MATGSANPRGIEHCTHGEAVLRSTQNGTIDSILHRQTGRKWSIHMTLVESECQAGRFKENIYKDCYILGSEHDPATFDLFVQWLYTRRYQEKQGLVVSLAYRSSLGSPKSDSESMDLEGWFFGMMDWTVKAAILCWQLGASLGAKGFQNYAMERLFEALSRPLLQPLTANLILRTCDVEKVGAVHGTSPLQRLIQDVIVRNWGDDTIVQHGDQEQWSDTLEACHFFRMNFIEATRQSLERRREHQMSLADYLIR
ncbi:hypothetical protein J4E83_010856 [Alternaria metachromatica]|uniref:uncharacterized protein n=1 Tax=Alternaria metachromatica TaxID=283354 RepID=UPI0020C3345C|nr:uncharacterized protein J4E83_010856 [Alternaria metachromatica]KAI4605120.1 hypothetical protein J4E83_010856 [Alternaria metachromatica]